jgi:hypothetical protein
MNNKKTQGERLDECIRIRRQLIDFGLGGDRIDEIPNVMREFIVNGHGASGTISLHHLVPGKRLQYTFSVQNGRPSYVKISST